jgi:uncharacterized membrane protein HdeD (DUF308 family)
MNRRNAAFAVTLIRGLLAITLGVAMLVQPDKMRPMLVNLMGMYWLISCLISLRWRISGQRPTGLWLVAGITGVLAGNGMLGREAAKT